MNELFKQLGVNWKLFLSQAVNFFVLLIVLRAFVYKPLLAIIKERSKKIKEGLEKSEEASLRLKEVDIIAKNYLKQANLDSMNIIKETEKSAKVLGDDLQKKAEDHQKELMEQIQLSYQKQKEEASHLVYKEAAELVKKAIKKTVELNPEDIDEEIIKKAVLKVKNNEI